jgi:predicted dehydrogenase
MKESSNLSTNVSSRREFIKTTGRMAAASALAGMAVPYVHAAGNETLQVALIGCGNRGGGAAANALSVKSAPVKLVAMVDVFPKKLDTCYDALSQQYGSRVDVPPERKFIGFDGYRHAMDYLKPGDIAIFTTPLAFRWVHFTYAIAKGLNVFMEKPLTADGPSSHRMLKLAEEASAKNLKVGVGLMSRHSRALQELNQRIQDGEIGDIILLRGYRMAGPLASAFSEKWPGDPSELLWQISRFHSFIWASGGCFSDFYIHHIDHLCWMKNAWPVKAQALGGRHYRQSQEGALYVDQNFDSYSVEYTFADGAKLYMDGRCVTGCNDIYSSYAHGSKGMAIVAKNSDCGMPSSTHRGQTPTRDNVIWTSKVSQDEQNPYDNEWNDLVDAIRNDKPYNEVPRGVQASVVTSMGRMAAHTGQEITYEEMLDHTDVYAPGVENFTMDSPPPVRSGADGRYPIPKPGIITHHEYDLGATPGKEAGTNAQPARAAVAG